MSLDLAFAPGQVPTSAPGVPARIEALRRFLRAVDGHLPDQRLAGARTVLDRAGERLSLSRHHTVVALAGSTGSGKSSLFNALARIELSRVGVRRPTTAVAHACAWWTDEANPLLDWLGVPPSRRFARESALDADDEAALRGLVLLDLPDFDSVQQTHQVEADRLLAMADVVVWVLDPQKYADDVVHRRYLARFGQHQGVTVVLLNQADLLGPADAQRCVADLRRLLAADGLTGVPVLATSTVGRPGLGELRALLERSVAACAARLDRLGADLDVVVADLAPLVAAEPGELTLDDDTVWALTGALTAAAGVPATAEAIGRAHRQGSLRDLGWPLRQHQRQVQPDDDPGTDASATAETSAPAGPAAAAIGLAVRAIGDRAGAGLPAPWPAAVVVAARSRLDELPGALERAIAAADPGTWRASPWSRAVGAARWLATLAALAGLGWLGVALAGRASLVGPAVLAGDAGLAALALALVPLPVVRWSARNARAGSERHLRAVAAGLADQLVVAPVETVLTSYAEARAALAAMR